MTTTLAAWRASALVLGIVAHAGWLPLGGRTSRDGLAQEGGVVGAVGGGPSSPPWRYSHAAAALPSTAELLVTHGYANVEDGAAMHDAVWLSDTWAGSPVAGGGSWVPTTRDESPMAWRPVNGGEAPPPSSSSSSSSPSSKSPSISSRSDSDSPRTAPPARMGHALLALRLSPASSFSGTRPVGALVMLGGDDGGGGSAEVQQGKNNGHSRRGTRRGRPVGGGYVSGSRLSDAWALLSPHSAPSANAGGGRGGAAQWVEMEAEVEVEVADDRGQGGGGQSLATRQRLATLPPALAGHACSAIGPAAARQPSSSGDDGEGYFLCFGGSGPIGENGEGEGEGEGADEADGVSKGGRQRARPLLPPPPPDSDVLWLGRLVLGGESGGSGAGVVKWRRLGLGLGGAGVRKRGGPRSAGRGRHHTRPHLVSPPARHGHAAAYLPRAVVAAHDATDDSGGGAGGTRGRVFVEHAFYIFGGTSSPCPPPAASVAGGDDAARSPTTAASDADADDAEDGAAAAQAGRSKVQAEIEASSRTRSCARDDTWRYVWYTPAGAPSQTGEDGEDGEAGRDGVNDGEGFLPVMGGVWQRVDFGIHAPRPSAREFSAHAVVAALPEAAGDLPSPSLLIHGGAFCSPSCVLAGSPATSSSSSSSSSSSGAKGEAGKNGAGAAAVWSLIPDPVGTVPARWLSGAAQSFAEQQRSGKGSEEEQPKGPGDVEGAPGADGAFIVSAETIGVSWRRRSSNPASSLSFSVAAFLTGGSDDSSDGSEGGGRDVLTLAAALLARAGGARDPLLPADAAWLSGAAAAASVGKHGGRHSSTAAAAAAAAAAASSVFSALGGRGREGVGSALRSLGRAWRASRGRPESSDGLPDTPGPPAHDNGRSPVSSAQSSPSSPGAPTASPSHAAPRPSFPAPRYKHSLSAAAGVDVAHACRAWAERVSSVLLRAERSGGLASLEDALDAVWAAADVAGRSGASSSSSSSFPPPLPVVALLFGGESYGPSTYYADTWLWADGGVLDALLAGSGPTAPSAVSTASAATSFLRRGEQGPASTSPSSSSEEFAAHQAPSRPRRTHAARLLAISAATWSAWRRRMVLWLLAALLAAACFRSALRDRSRGAREAARDVDFIAWRFNVGAGPGKGAHVKGPRGAAEGVRRKVAKGDGKQV